MAHLYYSLYHKYPPAPLSVTHRYLSLSTNGDVLFCFHIWMKHYLLKETLEMSVRIDVKCSSRFFAHLEVRTQEQNAARVTREVELIGACFTWEEL